MSRNFLTTEELAQRAELDNTSIRRLISRGAIAAEKVAGSWVISIEEAERFLTDHKAGVHVWAKDYRSPLVPSIER